MGGLGTLLAFLPALWAKRTALLVNGLTMAYAIKNLLLFGSCYQGYCPEKKPGLFLMLIAAALILFASLFPQGELKKETPPSEGPQGAPDGIEE
jgi:hypothetical protein